MGLVFAVCLDSGEQALVLVSENPGPRQVQLKLKNLRLSSEVVSVAFNGVTFDFCNLAVIWLHPSSFWQLPVPVPYTCRTKHEVLSALFFVHFPLIELFVHAAAGQPSEEIEITTTKAGTAL